MADQLSLRQSQKKPRISKHEKSISSHHFQVPNAVISKRIYFYKSGDPQFSGIRMAINNRTFKTFDSLLDDLSNKIPLPFGVRTITTPHGSNSVKSLSDLKDGQSYICSDQRRVKPINLEVANRKQHPWFISKSFNREQLAIHQTRMKASRALYEDSPQSTGVPKKLVIFRNGDPSFRRNLVMNKQTVQNFEVLLKYITDLMHFPVVKLYSTVGKRIETLYPVKYVLDSVVAAGQEAYKPRKYDVSKLFLPSKFPAITNHVYPNSISKTDNKNHKVKSGRRQWMINSVSPASSKPQAYSASSAKLSINDSKKSLGTSFSVTKDEPDSYENCIYARGDNPVMPSEDDIEKSVYMNEDGSVTVEMKVHFRIKEEEVIEWTTTISNPGVCDKRSNACNSKLVSNVEAGDFVNVQSHHESRTMQFEDLEPEQVFDDLCTPPKFTMDIEMDKEGQYDIWQNNFSSTNDNLLESGVELCHYKGSPGHKSVKQGEVSQESIIAKFDTQSSGNIIQFPNIEETGLGEFTMEHDNEHFSIANEKNSHKIISEAISDNLHTREEINVNTHGKEKTMQDKSTSFVGKDSSRSSQPYFEDQLDAPKMINSISESTNAANVLSEYCGENGCADSNINLAKIYVRPSSGDPMCSISKQRKKDRRPMSASFQYSKASVSIHHETCNLSYGEVDSLTSIEKKQRKDANTSCTNSSGFCETRMSVFLSNLNSVSMCSPSSTVQYQNYTKTDKEVKMLTNTDSNDLSFTNEERAFSKTVNTSLTNTDLDFPSKINEQNCRKDSSENKNLYLKYSSHSQPSQILWQSENNEDVSDICTIPNGGHELTEVIDSDKYECTECNTTEIPDESKEGFHIGSGGDGTICHCLTDLKSPNEETNSNLSQLPVACPVDKSLTDTELLENRPHRIEDQHFITISNSYVTPSMPENISVANTCRDTFSEHEETSLMIACSQQLDQYHKDDDQCSTTTTEHNFNLSGSSSPMIGCDSESTSFGNGKQVAGINSSSFESAIPQCSSKPIRKKWKHVAKRNNKILNISTVEKDFKQDAQSAVLFPFLLPKNQELYNMDIPSSQKVMQNLLRSISPTSDLMHNDKDLGSYPPTSFAGKRMDNDLTSDVIKEANNLSDKDSDINDQSERNKAGANVLTEQKLEQSSDDIVCNVERIHEVSDDCSNDYLLQSQLNIAEGEIKHAPISNEIWCQPITEVTKVVSNMSKLIKETNEIAIQVDTGVVSEMADERNSMEEQDLRQVLCQLQSTVDTFKQMSQDRQKKYLEKSYGMPDMSEHLATTLSTPSKVLLAWLAVINLNVSLPPATEGALMNNCSCSEVLTFLELIRHVVKFQEADDSKQNISELQKYASHLVKLWANDYKEVSNYVCYNDPKLGCSVQTGTTTDKQTVVFGAPQLTINADNENYLDMQNLIEPNETKREVKINFSTYPNEEGKNKEAVKELGNKEVGLLNFQDNLTSDILEDQVTSDSIHQNEHVVENTVAMNMEWSEIKAKVLQQDEHLKTGAITQHEEFIDNTMENNENGHPVCLRGIEANDQFTHCNAAASTDGFLAVSDPMHPQTKIFPQSSMAQESLLAIDKYGPNHGNDFCQGEHMRRNHSSEMPVGKVSVLYNSDFENENKTDGKQQANKISENSFIESKADNMELLPYICPCVPSDHDVKQSLQRQQAHDLSEGDQTSVNSIASDYNSQASNEMTTEGEEDNFVKIKHFSANFVRKATERLYGKSRIASKLHSHNQSPLCNDKSTVGITCIAKNEPLNISGLEKGQTLQKSKNTNSHSEEEGVLIEKGRWLLKENHLIRKSPPSNLGMYENLDTTSDDTTLENTSDDTAYPHVNAMHSRPPLSELSSSEIEEMIKPGATCNYFSMPHASDSEPFSDQISLKSKQGHVCNDSHFSQKNESGKQLAGTSVQPTKLSFKDDNNDSPFASVGLHMFDNKVSPLAQPLPDGTVVEQAPGEAARINRTLQNPDSLDKLHFLCGQHCPILTAVIQSSNEESRRFVYQKKSDPENQWVPYLENEEDSYTVRKYNGLMTENGKCTELSKKIVDSIISDIRNWFKTPNIDNDINRIKSSLDAKYLGANNKILKPPLHTDKTGFKHKGKPFLSNVVTEAKKNDIRNIVEQWFMKQEVQNNIKAIKERINALSVQVQKLDNPSRGQTDPYHLSTRMATANNNVTIPLMENKIIGVDLPSENGNRNGEKELFCDSQKPMHGNCNK